MKGLIKMKEKIKIKNLESFCLDDILVQVKERKNIKKSKNKKRRKTS